MSHIGADFATDKSAAKSTLVWIFLGRFHFVDLIHVNVPLEFPALAASAKQVAGFKIKVCWDVASPIQPSCY